MLVVNREKKNYEKKKYLLYFQVLKVDCD